MGDIAITETIVESEQGTAEELSTGMNEKSNTCTTINSNGGTNGSGAIPNNSSTCATLINNA
jgi:hypothetical protein